MKCVANSRHGEFPTLVSPQASCSMVLKWESCEFEYVKSIPLLYRESLIIMNKSTSVLLDDFVSPQS